MTDTVSETVGDDEYLREEIALYLAHRKLGVKLNAPYPSLPPDSIDLWDRNTARGIMDILARRSSPPAPVGEGLPLRDIGIVGPIDGMGDPSPTGPYLKVVLTGKHDEREEFKISAGAAEWLCGELAGMIVAPAPVAGDAKGEPTDNAILPNKVLDDNYARALAADGASGSMTIDTSVVIEIINEVKRSRVPAPDTAIAERVRRETIEECIEAAKKALPRAHTYASENADLYMAQDNARDFIIRALRALSPIPAEQKTDRALEGVRRLIRPDSVLVAKDIHVEGFDRKSIYNALTYLTRTGELAHIGYGRYQSPPARPARALPASEASQ